LAPLPKVSARAGNTQSVNPQTGVTGSIRERVLLMVSTEPNW
jgi:hypothetical protein